MKQKTIKKYLKKNMMIHMIIILLLANTMTKIKKINI